MRIRGILLQIRQCRTRILAGWHGMEDTVLVHYPQAYL